MTFLVHAVKMQCVNKETAKIRKGHLKLQVNQENRSRPSSVSGKSSIPLFSDIKIKTVDSLEANKYTAISSKQGDTSIKINHFSRMSTAKLQAIHENPEKNEVWNECQS